MNTHSIAAPTPKRLLAFLNGEHHRTSIFVFMALMLSHWVEHLVQAFQIFVLGWSRPDSRGLLGQLYPSLVSSEWLHFGYAVFTLAGLLLLLPAFRGTGRRWWIVTCVVQVWHLVEHAILFVQAQSGRPWFGRTEPVSIVQLVFPRVELHLAYNSVITVLIGAALYFHSVPRPGESTTCTCSLHARDGRSRPTDSAA